MAGEDSTIDLKPLPSLFYAFRVFQLVINIILLIAYLCVTVYHCQSLFRNKCHINDQMEVPCGRTEIKTCNLS